MGRFTEANMSNTLSVVVPGNVNTIWASQPMGVVTPFRALLARLRQENVTREVDSQQELQLLLEEFRQDPTESKKTDLLWHITCHM